MNNVVRTGHLGRHRISRNHRLLNISHRDNDHDLRPFIVSCLIDLGRPRRDNRRLVADDPMTMEAQYPYHGRMVDRPGMRSCYKA